MLLPEKPDKSSDRDIFTPVVNDARTDVPPVAGVHRRHIPPTANQIFRLFQTAKPPSLFGQMAGAY